MRLSFYNAETGHHTGNQEELAAKLGEFYNRAGVNARLEQIANGIYPNGLESELNNVLPMTCLALLHFTKQREDFLDPEDDREAPVTSLYNMTKAVLHLYEACTKNEDVKSHIEPAQLKYTQIQLRKIIVDMKDIFDKSVDSSLKEAFLADINKDLGYELRR